MAAVIPQTLEEFGRIPGVGQAKLQQYGADFLQVTCAYAEANGIPRSDRRRTSGANGLRRTLKNATVGIGSQGGASPLRLPMSSWPKGSPSVKLLSSGPSSHHKSSDTLSASATKAKSSI